MKPLRVAPREEDPGGEPGSDVAPAGDPGRFDRLGDVEVDTTVELGRAEMLLRDLAALGPGSVVCLDRLVDEPVDLIVGGRLYGRGRIVVVAGRLGLRIAELADPTARPPARP